MLVAFVQADTEPTGERWPHLDSESVEAWRWRIWSRHHRFAPEEYRAEARARHDAERARVAANTTAMQEQVARGLDAQAGF